MPTSSSPRSSSQSRSRSRQSGCGRPSPPGPAPLVLAGLLLPFLGDLRTGPFAFALRDFAVAAALATQLNAPGAGPTAAVYGVLMLVAGTAATSLPRRRQTLAS